MRRRNSPFSHYVSGGGDLDADGHDDIVAGAYLDDFNETESRLSPPGR